MRQLSFFPEQGHRGFGWEGPLSLWVSAPVDRGPGLRARGGGVGWGGAPPLPLGQRTASLPQGKAKSALSLRPDLPGGLVRCSPPDF